MDAVAGFVGEGLCVEKKGPGFAKTLQEVPMIVYAITAVIFLALDAVMLSLVMKPLFTRHLGDTMRDSPLLAPAALFYLGYVAGLVYLVSVPALRDAAPERAALHGAVQGAMAYGAYEFTNLATLRGWHWHMVLTDILWGAALTAVSAWAGLCLLRALL